MTTTLDLLPAQWREHCTPAPQHEANTAAWLAERRNGVGASEISTIIGFNPYSSAVDLWEDKTGRRPIDTRPPSPQAVWGHRMEPFIRDDVADELGREVGTCGSVVSTRWPWLRCSVDGFFLDDGALLEIKTTGVFQRDQWADGQTSDHAELQVQAAMAVTGAPYAVVAVVIDRGQLELRRVERDDDVLIPYIVEQARTFWEHVETDTQPPLDGSEATTAALIARYPTHDADDRVDDSGRAVVWVEQYRQAAADEKAAAVRKREAANNLRDLIGGASRLTLPDGSLVASLRLGRVDEKRLAAEHPDIAATYTTTRMVLDTTRLKTERPDIYRAMQSTAIAVPKGA